MGKYQLCLHIGEWLDATFPVKAQLQTMIVPDSGKTRDPFGFLLSQLKMT